MQNITVNLNLNRGSCRILKPLYLGETVDLNFDTEGIYSLILTEPFADSPKDGIAVWAQSSEGKLALTRKALHNAFKKADATQPNMTISAKVFVQDETGNTVADGEVAIEYSPAAYIIDTTDYPTAAETIAQAMNAKDAAERAKSAAESAAQATVGVKDAAERAATNAGTEAGRAAKEAADAREAAIEAKNALASGSEVIKAAVEEEKVRAEAKELEIETNVAKINEDLNSTTEALNAVKDTADKASEALKSKADIVDGKIPASQIPGSVDDIEEVSSFSEFPAKGEANKIYLALDTNKAYRWGGSTYVEISPSIALGDTYTTAFPGNRGAAVEAAVAEEATRAKGAEAALDERVKELEENPSVEVVAPSPDGAGKAADAKAVYEELEKKRDLDNLDYARTEPYFEPGYILGIYNLDKTQLLKTVNLKLIEERHHGTFVTKVWEYRTDNVQYTLTGELAGYESYDWRFIASDEYGLFFAPTWHTSLLDGLETNHTVVGTNCVYELQYSESIEFTKTVDDKIALVSQIPAAPDLTAYAKTAEVPAAIAGKEIKPNSVVMESKDEDSGSLLQRVSIDVFGVIYEAPELGNEDPIGIGWSDLIITAKKYGFHECKASDFGGTAFVDVFPFKINHFSTWAFSGVDKGISIWLLKDENNVSNDLILVFDCYVEGYRIEWTEVGKEYTFHPRGGDAANLEVVAGKRNVFFITEVQPNVFMVARDELALPDAGGGE